MANGRAADSPLGRMIRRFARPDGFGCLGNDASDEVRLVPAVGLKYGCKPLSTRRLPQIRWIGPHKSVSVYHIGSGAKHPGLRHFIYG